jgi:DDE_Tnp_1-associated/Transposase DDE domain
VRSEPAVDGSGLLQFLQEIPDPRGRQGQRHDFVAMLATVVCAMLCGHGGFSGIAQWIHAFDETLWHRLGYRRTPPTENCFRDLLNALDPRSLEAALWKWIESLGVELEDGSLRATIIDGKKLRGAISRHQGMWHVLSALDYQTGHILRQIPVPTHSNEAKAVLELIDQLVLQGKVVVGDAMFCQRDVCERILGQGGDYLVIVKDNQPTLRRHLVNAFATSANFSPLPTAVGG